MAKQKEFTERMYTFVTPDDKAFLDKYAASIGSNASSEIRKLILLFRAKYEKEQNSQ